MRRTHARSQSQRAPLNLTLGTAPCQQSVAFREQKQVRGFSVASEMESNHRE